MFMEKMKQDLLNNFIKPNNEVDIENKKDHELNDNDRMKLINKKLDEEFLIETYKNFLDKKNDLNCRGCADVNEYVFNDVEFISDHYQNKEKGIFLTSINCERWKEQINHSFKNYREYFHQKLSDRQNHLLFVGDIYIVLPGGVGTIFEAMQAIVSNDINEFMKFKSEGVKKKGFFSK